MMSSTLIEVISADIVEPEIINRFIGLDYEDQSMQPPMEEDTILIPQIQELGFETYNPLFNLGGIFLFMIIYVLKTIISGLMKCCSVCLQTKRNREDKSISGSRTKKNIKKLGRFRIRFNKNLIFTEILAITMESVYYLTLSGLIFYWSPK